MLSDAVSGFKPAAHIGDGHPYLLRPPGICFKKFFGAIRSHFVELISRSHDTRPDLVAAPVADMNQLTHDEMVTLIAQLQAGKGKAEEASQWLDQLAFSLGNPRIAELIFYPAEDLTPGQVIERARRYRPFQMPPVETDGQASQSKDRIGRESNRIFGDTE